MVCKKGDILTFGSLYDVPLQWQIIDDDETGLLLLSKYAICSQPFNSYFGAVTWRNSYLRWWLNDEFYQGVFDPGEKKLILETQVEGHANPLFVNRQDDTRDKIFLMSSEEVLRYLNADDRVCAVSDSIYVGKNALGSERKCWWWLRTTGYREGYCAFVYHDGVVMNCGIAVNSVLPMVRPVLRLKK